MRHYATKGGEMYMKKKVFDLRKYIKDCKKSLMTDHEILDYVETWGADCVEGKCVDDIEAQGYGLTDNWITEIEVKRECKKKKKRYFKVNKVLPPSTLGKYNIKQGDVGEFLGFTAGFFEDEMYLLYNENWNGHEGDGTIKLKKKHQGHCIAFDENTVDEITEEEAA